MYICQEGTRDIVVNTKILEKCSQLVNVGFLVCPWCWEWYYLLHPLPVQEESQWCPAACRNHHVRVDTCQEELYGTTNAETVAQDMHKAGCLLDWVTKDEEDWFDHVDPLPSVRLVEEKGHASWAVLINEMTVDVKSFHWADTIRVCSHDNGSTHFMSCLNPRDVETSREQVPTRWEWEADWWGWSGMVHGVELSSWWNCHLTQPTTSKETSQGHSPDSSMERLG